MRVAAAGEKSLGQGNDRGRRTTSHDCIRTGLPRRKNGGIAKGGFYTDSQRTRKYEFFLRGPVLAERVIGGILRQDPAEICFRAKVTGGDPGIDRSVAPFRAFQIIVTLVANVAEARFTHPHWKRKQRDFSGTDVYVGGLDATVSKTIIDSRHLAHGLLRLHRSFQPLRCKGGNVEGVVIERCEG